MCKKTNLDNSKAGGTYNYHHISSDITTVRHSAKCNKYIVCPQGMDRPMRALSKWETDAVLGSISTVVSPRC
jgi:hypothetical protein